MAHASHRPWWWTFTDVELSVIASHLAAGGSFCCKHNEDARRAVTGDRRKLDLLAGHAYDGWGCYEYSAKLAGQGPYVRQNGTLWDKEFAATLRKDEIDRAARYLDDFLEDMAPKRGWPHPDGDLP